MKIMARSGLDLQSIPLRDAVTKTHIGLVAAALCFLARPACAEVQLQPGLWQETETGSENNQPAKSETSTRCMTPDEAKQPSKAVVFDETLRKHCRALDYSRAGDDLTLRMQCGAPGFTVNIGATFKIDSPQHYSGIMKVAVQLGTLKFNTDKTIDAKRIGECTDKK
jgi:Protein of unknown function (DUF3617)